MTVSRAALLATGLMLSSFLPGCTGGQEGSAAEEKAPARNPMVSTASAAPAGEAPLQTSQTDPRQEIKSINTAIPIYAGAKYRDDLTRRDSVMIRSQYGPNSKVYTLATDDSYPQVYHYYTTYLAQFRAYPAQPPYPALQNWRTLEVQLNHAMQDPFIPGDTLNGGGKQVTLQVAETEAEPRTVIRYIITPQPIQPGTAVQ